MDQYPQVDSRPFADATAIGLFNQALQQAVVEAGEFRTVALLVVSLNRSDRIASVLDDPVALAVTRQLLDRVRTMLREADRCLLVHDDEIWLMLPGLRVQAMATLALNRLLALLQQPFFQEGRTVFLHPAIGMALAPQNADAALPLMRAADQARQAAHRANTSHAVSDAVVDKYGLPDDLEAQLKEVLANNDLTVAYQPKIDLSTGRVASVEALVRWPAEDRHCVPTVLLIETAERRGLIGALTNHVLNTVLRERSAWLQDGLDMQVWINISALSLADQAFPQRLLQALQVWNTVPSAIGLEITESGLIRDIDQATGVLMELQRLGFEMAIDDFGTGYSSLAYLRRFPITELKIDRMFLHNMVHSPPDHQIVRSIIDLAHNFGLKVVAEGAEDEATLAQLMHLGCDLVQGYVHAMPMASHTLVAWVRAFEGKLLNEK
ncbi:MAG: EAL domain-containing protein [Pseudomonadota bacterium]